MVGQDWPEAPERISGIFEAIEGIGKLFTGKEVKHDRRYFKRRVGAVVDDVRDSVADPRRNVGPVSHEVLPKLGK